MIEANKVWYPHLPPDGREASERHRAIGREVRKIEGKGSREGETD